MLNKEQDLLGSRYVTRSEVLEVARSGGARRGVSAGDACCVRWRRPRRCTNWSSAARSSGARCCRWRRTACVPARAAGPAPSPRIRGLASVFDGRRREWVCTAVLSQIEVAGTQAVRAFQQDREIRRAVAVDVALDQRVRARGALAQFAGDVGERVCAHER